jgi:3-hydroxyisobutyrate dehydrogenase-like beta-hydroxyacid dehydrogenase
VKVGLLHPGEMGAAVGALLVERGHEVLWLPRGHSAATARRARDAGLQATEHFDDVQVILSICPPHAALDVARSLAGSRALVIDANAVSPATARAIGAVLGENWADGGIVGRPPRSAGTTRLYLSGPKAEDAAELFAGTPLEAIVLSGSPVAASALKMAYAAWTKGTAALLLAIRATARASGTEEALLAEWVRSQPDLVVRSQNAAISAATKGWRWVGEMDEIAATFAEIGLPAGFHEAAADIFRRSPQLAEPSLDDVVAGLLAPHNDIQEGRGARATGPR